MASPDPADRQRDRRVHQNPQRRCSHPALAFRQAGLFRILYDPEVPRNIRHAVPGVSAAQKAGLRPEGGPGWRKKLFGDRSRSRLFLPRGLYPGLQGGLRRDPQRIPQIAPSRRSPHQNQPVRPLLFRIRRNWYAAIHSRDQNVFCHHSRPQVFAHRKPREQRLLGFLAKAKPYPRAGPGDHLRPARQHQGQTGRRRRQRGQRRQRPAHGLYQRPGRQALRLGLSPHRVLWRAPSRGLQWRDPAASAHDRRSRGRIPRV